MIPKSIPSQIDNPFLRNWIKIKDRGALIPTGEVYRSADSSLFLRTGDLETIKAEATFAKKVSAGAFPVPNVTEVGELSEDIGYFIETSVGNQNLGELFRYSYKQTGKISDELFATFCDNSTQFFAAQIAPSNHQEKPDNVREGIQLQNVIEENPDIPLELFERAITKAEARVSAFPLVLTHGDFNPFNIMERGVIDFEHTFIAPAGFDVLPSIIYSYFFDFPDTEGQSTLIFELSTSQVSEYLRQIDNTCEKSGIPALSPYFADFVMLKSIWALCYEKMHDHNDSHFNRWHWRRNVMIHCLESYLGDKTIDVNTFFEIGKKF